MGRQVAFGAGLAAPDAPGNGRGGAALKMCLYNAKTRASVRHLAEKRAARHFVERSFKDAKSASGMTDHQVRRCQLWHHQMARASIGRW